MDLKYSKFRIIFYLIAVIVLGSLCYGIIKSSNSPKHVPGGCLVRLRSIDAAKEQWSLVNHKTTNDIPTWDDIRPFLPDKWVFSTNGILYCPAGGSYALGRVGEPATCSIGGPGHSFQP